MPSPFTAFLPAARRFSTPQRGNWQARALAALVTLGAVLLLAGCAAPGRANVGALFRDITGTALDERLPPPGVNEPTPNLASVPPIPERPDSAARTAILRRLEGTRDAAGEPLATGRADAPLATAAAPGRPPIPATPPGPPRLSRAPGIPWGAVPVRAMPEAPDTRPEPGAVPPAPAAELLAPGTAPPPPSRDLLAP